jgi:glycosyltransferase involved in cell wall biosynthesis
MRANISVTLGVRSWYEQKLADVKASDVVLSVSHASKADIVEHLAIPENRVVVTENGYDSAVFHPAKPNEDSSGSNAGEVQHQPKLRPITFGGNDKHKNIRRLLAAFALIPAPLREKLELVLGGTEFPSDPEIRVETGATRTRRQRRDAGIRG